MDKPVNIKRLALTRIADQQPICLYERDTGWYAVTYGEFDGVYDTLKGALNSYNQCCLHAETAAGFHD